MIYKATKQKPFMIQDGYHYMVIKGKEYDLCAEHAQNMWAGEKTSNISSAQYNRGCCNSAEDPTKAERIGTLGEMAVGKLFGWEINLNYQKFGDNYDFLVNDWKIDVKTATRNYGATLVKRESHTGHIYPLTNDIYICCYMSRERKQQAIIAICGFETKENMENYTTTPARRGKHKNIELPFSKIQDITKIKDVLNNR